MNDFCKVFNSEKYGQILAIADTNDEGYPALIVKLQPKGMGICGPEYKFTDSDEQEAWRKVDKLFDDFNIDKAEKIAEELNKICDKMQ